MYPSPRDKDLNTPLVGMTGGVSRPEHRPPRQRQLRGRRRRRRRLSGSRGARPSNAQQPLCRMLSPSRRRRRT